jgi:hypothetical protein
MVEWDDDTEKRWWQFMGAAGSIITTANHDPLDINNAWLALDTTTAALRQHLESQGSSVEAVLADPDTLPRLMALVAPIQMSPAEWTWALGVLRNADTNPGTSG